MLMANPKFYLTLLLFICLLKSGQSSTKASRYSKYVRDACSVTQYRTLCMSTLAPFSRTAKTSPSKWARAGVSVTIGETKNVARYLIKLKNSKEMKGRYKIALSDCIECYQDAIDLLHASLGILRKLNSSHFYEQTGDLTTWLSAALTDQDTCLDGFEDSTGKEVKRLRDRVLRSSYFTRNALALVDKLANCGLENMNDP